MVQRVAKIVFCPYRCVGATDRGTEVVIDGDRACDEVMLAR